MYDVNGCPVKLRRLRYPRDWPAERVPRTCGILCDLTQYGAMYKNTDPPEMRMAPRRRRTRVFSTSYPMAGTQKYGHYQVTNDIPAAQKEVLATVVEAVRKLTDEEREMRDEASDEAGSDAGSEDEIEYDLPFDPNQPPIQPLQSQAYNVFSHRIRPKGGRHHEAQLGLHSQCLAWSHAVVKSAIDNGAKVERRVRLSPPQRTLEAQIAKPGNTDMRFEFVLMIRLQQMQRRYRRGK